MKIKRRNTAQFQRGFTRVDLIAVVGITATLAAMLLTAVRQSSADSQTARCLANLQSITRSWTIYVEDNDGTFPRNWGAGDNGVVAPNWASGWLSWNTSPDNTNTLKLTESEHASISPYLTGGTRHFKCPSDHYLSQAQRDLGWKERVRSYSMNAIVGGGSSSTVGHEMNSKAELSRASAQRVILLVDEHADSINDAEFYSDLSGPSWIDLPASNHDGAGAFSFVDGHVELRHWRNASTLAPVRLMGRSRIILPAFNEDFSWMRERLGLLPSAD